MSTPWQPPQYEEVRIRPGYTDWLCPRCGGVVTDIIAHNRHHKALDDLQASLLAISQVIVPGLPPGVMLIPETAVKINFVPGGEGGEPGGEGGKGAVLATDAQLRIGRGGGGNNPDIPTCPRCGAYGGGGHGGGCPNSGRPVDQWVSS